MADHSISISNSITVYGMPETAKWGSFTWGVDNWGYVVSELALQVDKVVSNSLAMTSTVGFSVGKLALVESFSFSSEVMKDVRILRDYGTVTPAFETSSEFLQDGHGYYYNFTKPATDAENRANTVWTSSTVA